MRHSRPTLTTLLAVAILALAPAAFAGDTTVEGTHFKISTSDAGTVEFDLDELAVGESRHFTTDTGKPVDVTRTEAGYELAVDGKKLDVILDGEDAASMRIESAGEGDGEREVVFLKKRAGDGSGEPHVVVMTEGDDGEGGKRVIRKRIITSGGEGDGEIQVRVLDGDEDIDLEGLEVGDDGDGHVVVIKKKVHEGEAGESGEPRQIEIRVEKKVKKETGEGDDRR